MKITWNNLNQWFRTSPLWAFRGSLTHERMARHIRRRDGTQTPWMNVLWREIEQDFQQRFGQPVHLHSTVELGKRFSFSYSAGASWYGPYSIRLDVHADEWTSHLLRPPGNMEYTEGNIAGFVRQWVESNLLYPGGVFRQIQLDTGCDKRAVREWYRLSRSSRAQEAYDERASAHAFTRRTNIEFSDDVDFMEAVAWFRKHGMQAQRIRLCRFHWGFMEMFDGDIEEAEKMYWDEVNDYPENAVFIS